jgi:GT2 family glycosyltransferase
VTAPRITAVVVVHGSGADTVRRSVQSLLDSSSVEVRVVLVDNASPDGGAACAAWRDHPDVDLVTSARNDGFASGVNQGLRRREAGDLVVLLNDDATVEHDALARCVAALRTHDDVVAVAPRVMLADEPDLIDSIGVVLRPNGEAFNAHIGQPWTGQVSDGSDVLGPCFSACLFRADAFDDDVVGPLDERYRLYYEDIDWSVRARRAGLRTIAATDAVVFHQHAASTRLLGEPARYELVQRNLLLCATKNLSARVAAGVWWQRLVVHAKGVITGPYRAERARSILRALAGAPSALAARRRLPKRDRTTDAQLFAYAQGMSPRFDAETYRARPLPPAN